MKKVAVFSFLLIFFVITLIANNPIASVFDEMTPAKPDSVTQDDSSGDALRSSAPIPSPQTLLLIGSGLIGLIIYRKKFKDRK